MHRPHTRAARSSVRCTVRGAALLETLIVLPVMLTIAFNALEFSRYGQARMIVRYAQVQGMRECAASADHPNNPTGDANGNTLALIAASEALRPWNGKWFTVGAMTGCHVQGDWEQAPVDFPVVARYKCSYPLSFCRGMTLAGLPPEALSMPTQTAYYDKQAVAAVDPSTVCTTAGGTKVCELTTAVDAGAPPVVNCSASVNSIVQACASCKADAQSQYGGGTAAYESYVGAYCTPAFMAQAEALTSTCPGEGSSLMGGGCTP